MDGSDSVVTTKTAPKHEPLLLAFQDPPPPPRPPRAKTDDKPAARSGELVGTLDSPPPAAAPSGDLVGTIDFSTPATNAPSVKGGSFAGRQRTDVPHVTPSSRVAPPRFAVDAPAPAARQNQEISHQSEMQTISGSVLKTSMFGAAGRDIQHLLQDCNRENPVSGARNALYKLKNEMAVQGMQGGTKLSLDFTSAGNNWHINLTDLNARIKLPDPGFPQTATGRRQAAEDMSRAYQMASLKDDLDVNIALSPAQSDKIQDLARRTASGIKGEVQKLDAGQRQPDGSEPILLNPTFTDDLFQAAIDSRPKNDKNGKEVAQTAVTEVNRALRGSGLAVQIEPRLNEGMSPELVDYCKQHPLAIPMTLWRSDAAGNAKVCGEYAYDPEQQIAQARDQRTPSAMLCDRVKATGTFTDPAGADRRGEHTQLVQLLQSQDNVPKFVNDINQELNAVGSQYYLQLSPREPNRPQQLTVINSQVRRGQQVQMDFVQFWPK